MKRIINPFNAKETAIAKAPIDLLMHEYALIELKKSKLSARLRYVVRMRVHYLQQQGKISLTDPNSKTDATK